jgi:subtilisin family serine protease
MRGSRCILLGCLGAGCAGGGAAPRGPTPEPERPRIEVPRDSQAPTPNLQPIPREPAAPAALAHLRGWMPLAATGVPAFRAAHPVWDGRGVLIAILDSGIDPGVAGLDSTSAGRAKLLDLRDFSGEGRIKLLPVALQGDTAAIGGRRLAGISRVRALVAAGPWYGGILWERGLGEPPAADLNDNGLDSDSLTILVGKAADGWVLFADTDGDGSLANERAVHDYLTARESFGWHRRGAAPPLNLAANFSEDSRGPVLDLVFDTDAHGSHVAGIAAAHNIGGVAGFDGVAPGAQLLGLKISRNDFGGVTTTGSMLAALDYAIRFAAARRLPLVANLSFGVGNEREGAASIDRLLDSVLALHPDVSFVTSAGNDGPGLSTMGFPGSLRRGITVGATQPAVFFTPPGRIPRLGKDPLLFFSSRGGELAKPDLVAPGTAYSTVPRWNLGEEFKTGTSMASPHVAGLAAILLSAALAEHRSVLAEDLRRALKGSARTVPGQGILDAGAGVPELGAAWRMLQGPAPAADFDVELVERPELSAAFTVAPADSLVRFRLRRIRGNTPVDLSLSSDVAWLKAPATLRVNAPEQLVTLVQHAPLTPGIWTGSVRATAPGSDGPLFSLVTTVVVPDARRAEPVRLTARVASGAERRVVFGADSGRPFRVRMATEGPSMHLIAALHQPGGVPILGENGIPGGPDTAAAVYEVDGRDARAGLYQAVAVAPPGAPATVRLAIDHSPVLLRLANSADSLTMRLTALGDSAVSGRFRAGLFGAERRVAVSASGADETVLRFLLPAWARDLVVDLELDPEQWPHFTDFGFTALDSAGRILGKEPANYAHARLSAALPDRGSDQPATIVLAPAFAAAGSTEPWSARVTIRLRADRPVALEAREGDEFRLAGKASASFHARLDAPPWPLPEGFRSLLLLLVESGGITWTWELASP